MKQYLFQNAVALDQLANTMIPGGMADETLSARAYRMREKKQRYWGWLANAINLAFFWQDDHCKLAFEGELRRRQLPGAYRAGGEQQPLEG